MTNFISVIIPTYNPKKDIFQKTIDGLKIQTLPCNRWELIIIDNNSSQKVEVNLDWHPNNKIIFEPKQGLSYARLNGFSNAKGDIVIMVDDDNILNENYLKNCLNIFIENSNIGAFGGKSLPLFEIDPPLWAKEFYGNLALRDLGDTVLIESWKNKYPYCSPIGAGMVIRKNALQSYLKQNSSGINIIADRSANSLTSGGDNDIIIEILKSGWLVGYFPELSLTHIIPKERLQLPYLARLIKDTNKSWVQLLEKHQINPWKKIARWTVLLRKLRSWFKNSAWKNEINYLKWKASCGYFEGLAK